MAAVAAAVAGTVAGPAEGSTGSGRAATMMLALSLPAPEQQQQ